MARPALSLAPGKALAPLDPHNKKVSYVRGLSIFRNYAMKFSAQKVAVKMKPWIRLFDKKKIFGQNLAGPAATHANEGISHNDVLAGRHGNNISIAIKRSKRDEKSHISEADFYLALRDRYLMSKEQLYENGYPIWVDDLTKRLVAIKPSEGRRQRYVADENLKRVCSRCGFEYRLTKDGMYASEVDAECIFHFGKAWKKRYNGTVDTRYTCCEQDLSIKGCTVMERHITDTIRQSTLHQYVETPRL
uniref:Elongin A binding-protein 1 domain-containing protein n=1 Tax=Ditylenchus dipsaci TaxID=166011 RepID=A0A915DMI8_9BILA